MQHTAPAKKQKTNTLSSTEANVVVIIIFVLSLIEANDVIIIFVMLSSVVEMP